ncbi:MAG: hypothetical protein CL843_07970 [Crocinitomicaceae bacterium]|nr:hypothetical protein [Crocinitomicaceae bacterium]
MVDTLVDVVDKQAKSSFLIKSDNVLVNGNSFSEGGLVENMAQTAALYAGYNAQKNNAKTPIGFIGAIKNLKVNTIPEVGQRLYTEVNLINEVMSVQIVRAEVKDENQQSLASCEMRVFIQPEDAA